MAHSGMPVRAVGHQAAHRDTGHSRVGRDLLAAHPHGGCQERQPALGRLPAGIGRAAPGLAATTASSRAARWRSTGRAEASMARQSAASSPVRPATARCAASSNILPPGPAPSRHAWRIASWNRAAASGDLAWELASRLAGRALADVTAVHSRSIPGVPPAQGRTYFSASVGDRRSSSRANTVAVGECWGEIDSRRA